MAIKGKAKSRSKKTVAAGPKPAYVAVKTPLIRRRGFWIGLAAVVAVASVAGIAYGFAKEQTRSRDEELAKRLVTAATRYQSEVDPILAGIGSPSPPSNFTAMSSLTTALGDLQKGTSKPTDAATAAAAAAKQAKSAYAALGAIDVTKIIVNQGFDQGFVLYMIDSQKQMVAGLKLFEQSANLLAQASGLHGDARAQLLDSTSGVLALANSTFNDGYSDYVQAQSEAGTFQPSSILPGATGAVVPSGAGGTGS
jgi:cation transport regulator ChaC